MYPNESNWLPKRLLQVPSFCFVSGYLHKMLLEQQPFLCKGADIFSRLALKERKAYIYSLDSRVFVTWFDPARPYANWRLSVNILLHVLEPSRTKQIVIFM